MHTAYPTMNNTYIVDQLASAFVQSIDFDEKFLKTRDLYAISRDTERLLAFLQSKNCEMVNSEEIKNFLTNHTSITGYLYEAPDIIRSKFGNAKLNLELSFDPESNDDEGELFLNIETNLEAKEAHDKLNKIDIEWFLKTVGRDVGKFNLNLDFI